MRAAVLCSGLSTSSKMLGGGVVGGENMKFVTGSLMVWADSDMTSMVYVDLGISPVALKGLCKREESSRMVVFLEARESGAHEMF